MTVAPREVALQSPRFSDRQRGAVAVVVLIASLSVLVLIPLIWNRHFFYFDDTAGGAYGQWYELGKYLLDGQWPLLNPRAWMAGNYTVEQFGLLNPVVWLIALASHAVEDAATLATVVKWAFLQIGALGVYALSRHYGARRIMAVSAGLAAATAGFTFYLDATAWVTNLQVWAYFPWVFWGLARYVSQRRSYAWAFVPGYLLVTVAYVQGTLMLILLFIVLLIDRGIAQDLKGLGRVILAGAPLGLLTVAVYLPAILSSDVTVRNDTVGNTGFMALTLNGLAVASNPYSHPDLSGFWGRYSTVPYTYIAWFIPLVFLCRMRRAREILRELRVPFMMLIVALAFAMGPSDFGPLRFPIRTMPWVAITSLVLIARLLTDGIQLRSFTRRKLVWILVLVAAIYWLSYAANPAYLRGQVITGVCMAGVILFLYVSGRRSLNAGTEANWKARLGVITVVGTMVVIPVQVYKVHQAAESFGQSGFPSAVSSLERPLDGAKGETLVVGDPGALGNERWSESSFGNLWYMSSTDGINLYSPTGFAGFNDSLCMDAYYGITCYGALDKLFEEVPSAGGTRLVDLLSIDTIQVLSGTDGKTLDELGEQYPVPDGWVLADNDDSSFTWVREGTIEPAGNPVWASDGVQFTLTSATDDSVTVHIDAVPESGGSIIYSRLAWPGYTVTNASLGEPVEGYLLSVDLDAASEGQDVTIVFRPPAFRTEIVAFVVGLASALLLVVAGWAAGSRRRRSTPPGEGAANALGRDPGETPPGRSSRA